MFRGYVGNVFKAPKYRLSTCSDAFFCQVFFFRSQVGAQRSRIEFHLIYFYIRASGEDSFGICVFSIDHLATEDAAKYLFNRKKAINSSIIFVYESKSEY